MVQFAEYIHLVQQNVRIADQSFVDNFDNAISVGRLFEFCPENCAVSSSADGLHVSWITFW